MSYLHRYTLVYEIVDEDKGQCKYKFNDNLERLLEDAELVESPWKIYDEKNSEVVASSRKGISEREFVLCNSSDLNSIYHWFYNNFGSLPECTPIRIEVYRLDQDNESE